MLCKNRRSPFTDFDNAQPFLNTRRVSQHRWKVERVGVLPDDLFTNLWTGPVLYASPQLRENVWTPGFAHPQRLLSTLHKLLCRGCKIQPFALSFLVAQAHSWEADRIFQDIYTLFSIECPHLFQSYWSRLQHSNIFLHSCKSTERLRTYWPFKRE